MMFHIVPQAGCWFRFPDHGDVYLRPVELALMTRGEGHRIASDERSTCKPFFEIPMSTLSKRFEFMRYGGGGEETLLVCGVLSFDHVGGKKLIAQMPPLICVKSINSRLPHRYIFSCLGTINCFAKQAQRPTLSKSN